MSRPEKSLHFYFSAICCLQMNEAVLSLAS